ncbi:hypothetical protein UK12_23950 [Saccharothrix sp. ST-888]|nr:hypothetical protein UK12_23950 [Saccharothrix sp. ST-888]
MSRRRYYAISAAGILVAFVILSLLTHNWSTPESPCDMAKRLDRESRGQSYDWQLNHAAEILDARRACVESSRGN